MAAASTIATVGTTFGYKFLPVKVQTAGTAMPGAGAEFYIVYKIGR